MAFRLGDAVLFFGGDTSDLDRKFDQSEGKAKGFGSKVGGVLGGVVKTGAVAAAAAVVAIGAAAFSVSQDTEKAARKIEAQLGTTREEAERLAEAARGAFGNNFAESVGEAGQAVALLSQQMEDVVGQEQQLVEKAFGISDAFEEPIEKVIAAASTLQEQFDDLTPDQAFDLIAKGFQKGLNKSDDFLDSIGEYSNLFGDAGFGADEFFSIMESGQQGGVLGTDKIADAVKEMGVRLNENAKGVSDAFGTMGMDFDAISAQVGAGDADWADYFGAIVSGLQGIEDPLARNEAQIAIFGTMAEDLGVNFTDGLDPALTKLAEMEGAADSLNTQYDTLGGALGGIWRGLITDISPVTDKLLDMANAAIPTLRESAKGLAALLTGDFSGAWETAKSLAEGAVEGIKTAFTNVVETAETTWANLVESGPGLYEDLKKKFKETDWAAIGTALMTAITTAVAAAWSAFVLGVTWYYTTLAFGFGLIDWKNLGKVLMELIIEAADAGWALLVAGVGAWFTSLDGGVKESGWGTIGTALMGFITAAATAAWDLWSGAASILYDELSSRFAAADWGAIGTGLMLALTIGRGRGMAAAGGWRFCRLDAAVGRVGQNRLGGGGDRADGCGCGCGQGVLDALHHRGVVGLAVAVGCVGLGRLGGYRHGADAGAHYRRGRGMAAAGGWRFCRLDAAVGRVGQNRLGGGGDCADDSDYDGRCCRLERVRARRDMVLHHAGVRIWADRLEKSWKSADGTDHRGGGRWLGAAGRGRGGLVYIA